MNLILFLILTFYMSSTLLAIPTKLPVFNSSKTQSLDARILLAKGKKKDRKGKKRYLQGEARSSSSKTSIDFDAASIDGERRTPVGVQVGGTKQDNGYDLINLRLRWHPEMIKSTSNLETGKSQ